MFNFRSSNPGSGSAIRKKAGSRSVSGSALNQCGSETLPLSVNVGRVSVVEAMTMAVEAVRGLIKAVGVPIEVVGVPKEAVRVQHSHSLYNTLTTVRKLYYKPREYL